AISLAMLAATRLRPRTRMLDSRSRIAGIHMPNTRPDREAEAEAAAGRKRGRRIRLPNKADRMAVDRTLRNPSRAGPNRRTSIRRNPSLGDPNRHIPRLDASEPVRSAVRNHFRSDGK